MRTDMSLECDLGGGVRGDAAIKATGNVYYFGDSRYHRRVRAGVCLTRRIFQVGLIRGLNGRQQMHWSLRKDAEHGPAILRVELVLLLPQQRDAVLEQRIGLALAEVEARGVGGIVILQVEALAALDAVPRRQLVHALDVHAGPLPRKPTRIAAGRDGPEP